MDCRDDEDKLLPEPEPEPEPELTRMSEQMTWFEQKSRRGEYRRCVADFLNVMKMFIGTTIVILTPIHRYPESKKKTKGNHRLVICEPGIYTILNIDPPITHGERWTWRFSMQGLALIEKVIPIYHQSSYDYYRNGQAYTKKSIYPVCYGHLYGIQWMFEDEEDDRKYSKIVTTIGPKDQPRRKSLGEEDVWKVFKLRAFLKFMYCEQKIYTVLPIDILHSIQDHI